MLWGSSISLSMWQCPCGRLDAFQPDADRLELVVDNGHRVVAELGPLAQTGGRRLDLDLLAAAPVVGMAVELGMERELEVGEAPQRDTGLDQLLAGRSHELGRCR